MTYISDINTLVKFINTHEEFDIIKSNFCFYNNHLGAILADIILQAGLNYKSVVFPRVTNIYNNYPLANNLSGLVSTIEEIGINSFLNWKNSIKINRFNSLIDYLQKYNIYTTYDLVNHLQNQNHIEDILTINGIGKKTIDYFFKLMNVDTVAVDRHIIKFLDEANIEFQNYATTKKIVEYAADILQVSRRDIDYSIWTFMSQKNQPVSCQLSFSY